MDVGFLLLRDAIVMQAAQDYQRAQKILRKNPGNRAALETKREVEEFMLSDLFGKLMPETEHEEIIELINKEAS